MKQPTAWKKFNPEVVIQSNILYDCWLLDGTITTDVLGYHVILFVAKRPLLMIRESATNTETI